MKEKYKQIRNRKALFNYNILEKYEAGIELKGTEVKSLREGKTHFKDSYIDAIKGELFVLHWNISQYENRGYANHDPERPKKLLLHKKEIARIIAQISQKGLTLVPLSVYFKGKHLKMEIALASGKKLYNKKDTIAEKDAKREIDRATKNFNH